jgi:hypothetical protein
MTPELDRHERRRLIARGFARSMATAAAAFVVYFLLPLDHVRMPIPLLLTIGTLALGALGAWQLWSIQRAKSPPVRAIEGLATTIPLFVVLFAAAYFLMSGTEPLSFTSHHLTRIDALYFTVTVFATVGFGDITAATQTARLVVSAQMILDLILLGLVVRLFLGAARIGREQRPPG